MHNAESVLVHARCIPNTRRKRCSARPAADAELCKEEIVKGEGMGAVQRHTLVAWHLKRGIEVRRGRKVEGGEEVAENRCTCEGETQREKMKREERGCDACILES